ncbi:CBO0543 family protein [Lentibacillus amyloliquefaciens]|uniref:Uncharacterized protein n=1 Tax=Lentibacillus amyloliquefaciens TaxID=1472767 RepID=A0A0U4G3Q9_9BACI|nr:CBO0543 family protein [Lentibacillus amyloliquefaciens]ALX47258.1 hypothetical protein AOX59_00770 [Lentibacillus amyloliquefaciens]
MEIILLWLFLISGLVLLTIALKKHPLKDWLICFFASAYFATVLGDLVVKAELLSYPVQLAPQFQSSVLYEYLLLPLICIVYYQTTYQTSFFYWCWQAFVYSSVVTFVEVLLETHTALIYFDSWHWYYSLISLTLFLLFIRCLLRLIYVVKKS